MPAYLQMGNDSSNLLDEPSLSKFAGAILSPVNDSMDKMQTIVRKYINNNGFTTIFDPQLYYPRTSRETLKDWPYFPSDYSTISATRDWWININKNLEKCMLTLQPDAVCSPMQIPKTYSIEYYEDSVVICNDLQERLAPQNIEVIQTLIVNLADLTDYNKLMTISSVIGATKSYRVYILLLSDERPRKEFSSVEEIKGAMRLIKLLENANLDVIMGFCSSDAILWKTAGAKFCASGKFWSLRRFTSDPWHHDDRKGGPPPYWFEENLLASIRESDFIRLQQKGLLSEASRNNPYYDPISKIFKIKEDNKNPQDAVPVPAWHALSWRQYLYWFIDIIDRIEKGEANVNELLKNANDNWVAIENKIIMDEISNNGGWIPQWRRAVIEYLD